jgi:hypothetical protein
MFRSFKNLLHRARNWLMRPVVEAISNLPNHDFLFEAISNLPNHDFLLQSVHAGRARAAKNPLNHFGAKYFSQTDEDGITLEIVKRIGIACGTFAELGVGNGLENNTLILLANGWRGFWLGGEELSFNHHLNPKRRSCFAGAEAQCRISVPQAPH